jgi:hypothetical protein
MGTNLGTPVTSLYVRKLGNGGTVPYYVAIFVQLGTFPTQWVAGNTLQLVATHIATGEVSVPWNITIPAGTGLINLLDPVMIVPPFPAADTWTYNLTLNGPVGTQVTGPDAVVHTLPLSLPTMTMTSMSLSDCTLLQPLPKDSIGP